MQQHPKACLLVHPPCINVSMVMTAQAATDWVLSVHTHAGGVQDSGFWAHIMAAQNPGPQNPSCCCCEGLRQTLAGVHQPMLLSRGVVTECGI
jgi:hypothetical protein